MQLNRFQKLIICVLPFLSGGCALSYEILWMKTLNLTIGHTSYSITIVVSCFMLGLALGGWFIERTNITANALKVYAVVEFIIAIYALLSRHWLSFLNDQFLGWCRMGWVDPSSSKMGQLVVAFAVLLVPTFLMGTTFPLYVRVLRQIGMPVGKAVGILNMANTLGGALGSFLISFFAIGLLGMSATLRTVALLNIAIAAVAGGIARVHFQEIESNVENPKTSVETVSIPSSWFLALTFMMGFVTFSYELIWTRLISVFQSGSSTYAFAVVLSSFLVGSSAGSFAFARWFQGGRRLPQVLAVAVMCFAATSLWMSMAIFWFRSGPGVFVGAESYSSMSVHTVLGFFMKPFLVLVIPTFFAGFIFPLMSELYVAAKGEGIGSYYAWNTFGCVLGTLITGFLLFAKCGSDGSAFILSIATFAVGGMFLAYAVNRYRSLIVSAILGVVIFIAMVCPLNFLKKWCARNSLGDPIDRWAEGDSAMVWGSDSSQRSRSFSKQLDVNGQSIAGAGLANIRCMSMTSHIPLSLHPNPEKVLVICFGTGITLNAASIHPTVKHLDCVEIAKEVMSISDYFAPVNLHAFKNRAGEVNRIWIDDGRSFLRKTSQRYDLIALEPPYPTNANVVNLYNREFYQICSDSLEDGGMIAQWIPTHCQSMKLVQMEIRTLKEVFPQASLWVPGPNHMILIGQKGSGTIDWSRVNRVFSDEVVSRELKSLGIENASDLMSLFLVGKHGLTVFTEGSEVITDDRPLIENFLLHNGSPSEVAASDEELLKLLFSQRGRSSDVPPIGIEENGVARIPPAIALGWQLEEMKMMFQKTGRANVDEWWKLFIQAYELRPENVWIQSGLRISDEDIRFSEKLMSQATHPQQKKYYELTIEMQKLLRQRNYSEALRLAQTLNLGDQSLFEFYKIASIAVNVTQPK
jgi:spermidine synthase